jgi:hypothetical protein
LHMYGAVSSVVADVCCVSVKLQIIVVS